jgi:hypothetical protein
LIVDRDLGHRDERNQRIIHRCVIFAATDNR